MNANTKSLMLIATCAALLLTNSLLLTNDAFHQRMRGLLDGIVGQSATTGELQALRSENEMLRSANRSLASSDVKLRLALNTLVVATDLLVLRTTVLVAEHARLSAMSRAQRTAAMAVRKKVTTRLIPSAARTVSSLPGKAAPVVGIGVLLAITALDLHDLCETLKDMNSLGAAHGDEVVDEAQVCGLRMPTPQDLKGKAAEYRQRVGEEWRKRRGSGD